MENRETECKLENLIPNCFTLLILELKKNPINLRQIIKLSFMSIVVIHLRLQTQIHSLPFD